MDACFNVVDGCRETARGRFETGADCLEETEDTLFDQTKTYHICMDINLHLYVTNSLLYMKAHVDYIRMFHKYWCYS